MKPVNFIEAVNSGKRFRPVDWDREFYDWIDIDGVDQMISHNYFNAQFELEEKTITITESELEEKADKIYRETSDEYFSYYPEKYLNKLKKELGF